MLGPKTVSNEADQGLPILEPMLAITVGHPAAPDKAIAILQPKMNEETHVGILGTSLTNHHGLAEPRARLDN
ncbi:hypothetical protein [Rhizobium leguminosarum]|uniref:hypothetical protein n=1 Tax=Rhizobium leguminosarum TaxID=384 RepID=UPI0010E34EBA|nr:hypothetical protein [Rhizobium leguminosarum]QIO61593.1 hypothetical protein HA463_28160 [Rhizobium leguminosarum bv. trifolii]TBY30675.1 hypothetical protein E0H55_20550 [Rhizobium leguminosarum bv. viciae]